MADAIVGTGNYGRWQIVVDLAGQDWGRNVSAVRVRGIVYNDGSVNSYNNNGVGVSVSGSYSNSGAPALSVGAHSSQTMFDWTFEIAHDANGYQSVWLSAHLNATGTSNIGGPADVAVGMDLPRIPKPPDPPQTGVDNITATSARILIDWPLDNHGAGVDWFGAWIMTNNAWPGAGGNVVASAEGGTFTATNLQRATTYFYTGQDHNAAGYSGMQTMKTFTTLATVPDQMAMPTVSNIGPDGALIGWTPPNNGGAAISSYDVQVATNSAFTTGVQNFNTTATSLTLTGEIPASQYWVRVRANNSMGPGAWSSANLFSTLSGIKVKVAGTWRNAKVWVKVNGAWVLAPKVWKKRSGSWVI